MKKLLASLLIAPLTMASCFGASGEDDWGLRPDGDNGFIIASIGKDGTDEITYTSKDFFDHVEGTPMHYDNIFAEMDFQLSKTIYINDAFATVEIGEAKYDEVLEDAEEEIRVQKEALESTVGSDWEEEWENIWDGAGYDSEKEYMENVIMLPIIKDAVNRMFYDWEDINVDSIIEDEEWAWADRQEEVFKNMLSATRSISMRHVLIKFDVDYSLKNPFEKADQNYSSEQTEKLNDAIDYLTAVNGDLDWNEFAEDHSEDGSATSGGHFKFEGLNGLSSVDEFKFASYDLAAVLAGQTYNNAGQVSSLDALKFSTYDDASTWKTDLEEYTRQAQIFTLAGGDKVAITMSEFGVHIIGVDGITTSTTEGSTYADYIMERAVEEKNLPNSASKPFHGDVTAGISTFYDTFSQKALLEFAMDKDYISFPGTEGAIFKDEFVGYFDDQFEVQQYVWVEEFISSKYTWIDESINEHGSETIALGKDAMNAFLNEPNVWGSLWAETTARGGN